MVLAKSNVVHSDLSTSIFFKTTIYDSEMKQIGVFFLLFIKILCGSIYLLESEFLRSRKLVATAKSRAVVSVIFLPRSLEKAHLF